MKNSKFKIQNFNKRNKNFIFLIVILNLAFLILNFLGCATAPYVAPTTTTVTPSAALPGLYHRVEKGQTLWAISKIYGADLDEIVRLNHISDATDIEIGQLLLIPKQESIRPAYTHSDDTEYFIWPVQGRVVAIFGQTFDKMINKGINIQPYGNQDVYATRSGRVVFCDNNFERFGKTIIVDHGDGFMSVYAQNTEVFAKAGDYIKKGTVIARIDPAAGGRNSYLHFEIRKGHIPQNPRFYLSR
jgi:murein DD-endopeptidase MepM/ murein hydrolase activator NlpD